MMLSPTQLQEFHVRGFLVLDEFLDAGIVEKLILEIETLDGDSQSTRLRRGTPFARRNLLDLEFVRQFLRDSRITSLISSVAPASAPVRAILFDKTGSANWTVPWHQDRSIAVRERIDAPGFGPWSIKAGVPHVQPPEEILQRMLTLRFHLDPCSADNGPLRVIPVTHHRILNEQEVTSKSETCEQHACVTGAGGLLLMRPLILHASSAATNPSHRRVVHVEFGPKNLPDGLQWAANDSTDFQPRRIADLQGV